jgi:hypothetical protein
MISVISTYDPAIPAEFPAGARFTNGISRQRACTPLPPVVEHNSPAGGKGSLHAPQISE